MIEEPLFDDLVSTRTPLPLLPDCGKCRLDQTCRSPKMPVDGLGRKKLMVIGEASGATEDEKGIPFCGSSGKMVWEELAKHGVRRNDCWITNSISCRPPHNKLPPKSISYCRPLVVRNIEEKRPRVIILLGESAVKSVIGWLWKDGDVGGIARWAGWQIPAMEINAWLCPTWHPASFLHGESEDRNDEVRKLLWSKHLKAACKLIGSRPWNPVPNWQEQVRVELDTDEAAKIIPTLSGPIAFDIENSGLKPYNPELDIFSCAMSDGTTTISYPWQGRAIDATVDFLKSDKPKIAFNNHHEHLWALNRLGIRVKGWVGDGMLNAHVLDNRPTICSLEVQAFGMLGVRSFKSSTDKYLKADGPHDKNRIRELPLREILLRGGMDALIELKLWEKQRELIRARTS